MTRDTSDATRTERRAAGSSPPGHLEALHARIAPRFARAEPRQRALAYLRGLLSPVARKTGWQVAAQAGEASPDGMHRLLTTAVWETDQVRDDLRAYLVEHLADPQAILVVTDLAVPKKGDKSVGVLRQHSSRTVRTEHCQVGVYLAYATAQACVLLDRELYLPRVWAEDLRRRAAAGVPPTVAYLTRPEFAHRMLDRTLAAAVPVAWVSGDTVYGSDEAVRRWLERQPTAYVLAVGRTHEVWLAGEQRPTLARVADITAGLAPDHWQRLRVDPGTAGPHWSDWACLPTAGRAVPGWSRWLLVRRSLGRPNEAAYYLVFGAAASRLEAMVRVAGQHETMARCLESARAEVGLADYEVRHWQGWYRHITLAMVAHAALTLSRLPTTTPTAIPPIGALRMGAASRASTAPGTGADTGRAR